MPVGAILGSAVIGGGAAIYGANKTASAAKDAANASNQLEKYMYDTTRADQQPAREAGAGALAGLSQGMGLNGSSDWAAYVRAYPDLQAAYQQAATQTPGLSIEQFGLDHYNSSGQTEGREVPQPENFGRFDRTFTEADFRADPGYQFRLSEGTRAVEGSAAARGSLQSGGTLKGLTRFAQGTADQTYQDAYNRFNNDQSTVFNRLASLAGIGQTANSATQAAGQNYANAFGQNAMAVGQARAAGANQMAGSFSQIGQNLLGQFAGGGGGGGYTPMTAQSPYGFGNNALSAVPVQTNVPGLQAMPQPVF